MQGQIEIILFLEKSRLTDYTKNTVFPNLREKRITNTVITYKAAKIIQSKFHNVSLQTFNNLLPVLKFIAISISLFYEIIHSIK